MPNIDINWTVLGIGVAGCLIVVLMAYYIADFAVNVLCISGWWRGFIYVCAGFGCALVLFGTIILLTGGVK